MFKDLEKNLKVVFVIAVVLGASLMYLILK
jgi:hypothetical protein